MFRLQPVELTQHAVSLPHDFFDRVPRKGDRFRDDLTRKCLYVASFANLNEEDCVIVASRFGNDESIGKFADSCSDESDFPPSAVHFSQATTSSAATATNLVYKVRGGNYTVSAGEQTFLAGLIAAGTFISKAKKASAHLFWETEGTNSEKELIYTRFVHSNDLMFKIMSDLEIRRQGFEAPLHLENKVFLKKSVSQENGIDTILSTQAYGPNSKLLFGKLD